MTRLIATTAIAALIATGAFAKAHDHGVADGSPGSDIFEPGDTAGLVDDSVSKGQRGAQQKNPETRAGGIEPVVGNGKNAE